MSVKREPREPDVKATAQKLFGLKLKVDCPACIGKGCSACDDQGEVFLLPEDYR